MNASTQQHDENPAYGRSDSNDGFAVILEQMEREAFEKWALDEKRSDKLPIERHDSNGAYKDPRTYIAWYAWEARGKHIKPCRGIAHHGCDYLAACGSICNKCGQSV